MADLKKRRLMRSRTFGDGQGAFLRKLVGEIVDQLANQHKVTREDMKKSAREQVGFNLSG